MQNFKRIFIVFLIILSSVGCDQATKATAKNFLPHNQIYSYAGDMFRFEYTENSGAFLSLGAALPAQLRDLLFTVGVSIVITLALAMLLFKSTLTTQTTVALSLICGGGIGNLIDRLTYHGHVIDFLNIGVGSLRTGIFNIADVAITLGAVILILSSRWHEQSRAV